MMESVEKSIIACMIMDEKSFVHTSRLKPTDFEGPSEREAFVILTGMFNEGRGIDFTTLVARVKEKGSFLTSLDLMDYTNLPSASRIEAYVDILKEQSVKRQLMSMQMELGLKIDEEPSALIRWLDNKIQSIVFSREKIRPIKEIMVSTLELIEKRDGMVSSGFSVDRILLGGLPKKSLIVIASRPSMGKTALAVNMASNISIRGNLLVGFFSLEMSSEELMKRIISSECGIDGSLLRGDKLDESQWGKVHAFAGRLTRDVGEKKIVMIDQAEQGLSDIRSKVKQMVADGVAVVFIDYLQLMLTESDSDNRNIQIGIITRGLKALAKETNIPVVLLSQLSRGVEMRNDKRPMLSDLRDSGCIEQDADVVIFPYREEYYKEMKESKGELIVAKNRNGPTGFVKIRYEAKYSRFEDVEP